MSEHNLYVENHRHVSNDAVTAVRAMTGVDEATAVDVIESLRPHLDMPYRARISQLEERVRNLERRLTLSAKAEHQA